MKILSIIIYYEKPQNEINPNCMHRISNDIVHLLSGIGEKPTFFTF